MTDFDNGHEDLGASSLKNFCRRNDIGRSKAYQEIKEGRLRIRKVGRRTIVTRKDEKRWLDALPAGGPAGSAIGTEAE